MLNDVIEFASVMFSDKLSVEGAWRRDKRCEIVKHPFKSELSTFRYKQYYLLCSLQMRMLGKYKRKR